MAGLDPTPSLEHLLQALAWAEGKTPEAMARELAAEDWSGGGERLGWRQYITHAAFVDRYGEDEAAERMQAILAERHPITVAEHTMEAPRSHSRLSREYPEIFALALNEPELALQQIDSVLIHPDEQAKLKGEVIAAYGLEHPLEALGFLDAHWQIPPFEAQEAIIRSWARDDVEAALAYVNDPGAKNQRIWLQRELLVDMVDYAPIQALQIAVDSPISAYSDYTLQQVAGAYIKTEPEAAFEWLLAQDSLGPALLKAGIQSFVREQPEKAAALLQKAPTRAWGYNDAAAVVENLARKDLAAARAFVASIPVPHHREKAEVAILAGMVADHPESFLEVLKANESLRIPPRDFSRIAGNFASRHPEAALAWALSAPDSPATAHLYGRAAERLIRQDPNRVGELLANVQGDGHMAAAAGDLVKGWYRTEPARAMAWVQERASPEALEHVVPEISRDWFQQDSGGALRFTERLQPGKARLALLQAYIKRDAERNLTEVARFIDRLHPGDDLPKAMHSAFRAGADVQPEQAKAAVASIKNPLARDEAIRGAIDAIYPIDPQATIAWVEQVEMGDSEVTETSLRHLVFKMKAKDQQGTGEWILSLKDEKKRQITAIEAIDWFNEDDPVMTARLVNQAKPSKRRSRKVVEMLQNLPDRPAREAFLASVYLTAEEMEYVKEQRKKAGEEL